MPLRPEWTDIALRLALATLAGALMGLDRGGHGRPAGLRTTLLVCLAAAVAMIQMNLLLITSGKSNDFFSVMDVMRLPLGILSGMGFIGAGAIIRRENIVLGVTTAATLWFVTVIGLCFGGGQIILGLAGLVLGLIVLSCLRHIEYFLPQDRRATLILTLATDGPSREEIRRLVLSEGFRIASWAVAYARDAAAPCTLTCSVQWRAREGEKKPPDFLEQLATQAGVLKLEWQPLV